MPSQIATGTWDNVSLGYSLSVGTKTDGSVWTWGGKSRVQPLNSYIPVAAAWGLAKLLEEGYPVPG